MVARYRRRLLYAALALALFVTVGIIPAAIGSTDTESESVIAQADVSVMEKGWLKWANGTSLTLNKSWVSFVEFDVPDGEEIVRASLVVYVEKGSKVIEVARAGDRWDEAGTTAMPDIGVSVATSNRATPGEWLRIDVSREVSGPGAYDFVLSVPSGSVSLRSREASGFEPRLEIIREAAPTSSTTLPRSTTTTTSTTVPPPATSTTTTTSSTTVPPPATSTTTTTSSTTVPPPATTSTTTTSTTMPPPIPGLVVVITSPDEGTEISAASVVPIEATVEGPVEKIEFLVDGESKGFEDTAPFAYSWQISSADNGPHEIHAVAVGADGSTAISQTVSVAVAVEPPPDPLPDGIVAASAETDPVPHSGDAADDPAVWVNANNPEASAVIGTDKLGGLAVYDLDGNMLHFYQDGRPNNVDVLYGFPLGGGLVDLVVASERDSDTIRVYSIEPADRSLTARDGGGIAVGIGISGLCSYRSQSGRYYVFDSDSSGTVQQWELAADGDQVTASKERTLTFDSTTEGCTADDALGLLYIAEEDVGIWRLDADPERGSGRIMVDATTSNAGLHLVSDIEGLAVYEAGDGSGYLVASSQGSSEFVVYDRLAPHSYVATFAVEEGATDAVTYTDGIAVSSAYLGARYPNGLFVAQDDRNDSGNQNFKLVPWHVVAVGAGLDELPAPNPNPNPDPGDLPPPAAGKTYYVDSIGGFDYHSGASPVDAWRTLGRVDWSNLEPGDAVLLRRGSTWNSRLEVSSSGTIDAPVKIAAYGSGTRPTITGASTCVRVEGSHVVVDSLSIRDCSWSGVTLNGSHNRVTRSRISGNAAGVYVKTGATDNRIDQNELIDNNVMSVLTAGSAHDDSGAMAVLIHGDRTTVEFNTISGSDAFSFDYGRDGAAIEIYGGSENFIHHNLAIDNDAFAELGEAGSNDNTFAFNVVRSSLPDSVFLVTRGAESSRGPVIGTALHHNTVVMTGDGTQGFVCHGGCSPAILSAHNNIIQAEWKVGYADGAFEGSHNLYIGGIAQFDLGSSSKFADPVFADAANGDFHLTEGSPAIDTGVGLGYSKDYDGASAPVDGDGSGGAEPDRGAFEYRMP